MILSHKYRFIYIKAAKVAGSSVLLALAKYCGEKDRVRAPRQFPQYDNKPLSENPHVTIAQAVKLIPQECWERYCKITIIRNPWDREVSRYWWQKNYVGLKETFNEMIIGGISDTNSEKYYFYEDRLACDLYMRFESLEDDYVKFCNSIEYPIELPLPRLKSEFRKNKRHYREYYTKETRDIVANTYKEFIEIFGYEF